MNERIQTMTENNTNPNEPQPLADEELASVSGGVIPQQIMDYGNYLDDLGKNFVMNYVDDDWHFLGHLQTHLEMAGRDREAYDVEYYMHNGKFPRT